MDRFSIFKWDSFSDQPHQIKDKVEKKRLKKENIFNILKTIFISLLLFPFFLFRLFFPTSKSKIDISKFFGIGINLDKGEGQIEILKELKIKNINIRLPLSDIENIENYLIFVGKFNKYNILLTVLQNRENIENLNLFAKNIEKIFSLFSEVGIIEFQIGNAINRSKWGFFSITEYLKFYQVAFNIKKRSFPNIKLIGSGVIDFEYYNTIHTLFNFQKIKYDGISSLLYVDRRGSPENMQSFVFNLEKKIKLLWIIVKTSSKSENKIYITETNYPIKNRDPYTPTSQFETVSLTDYKIFMVKYFLIALSSQTIERVYWHQLISAGYGLIDNRDNTNLKKYPAFYSFKTLLEILKGRRYISHKFRKNIYIIEFESLKIYWTLSDEVILNFKSDIKFINIDGKSQISNKITISKSPIYIFN